MQQTCGGGVVTSKPKIELPGLFETAYGFKWGQATVERICCHKGHLILSVKTKREEIEIRITPSGLIRHRLAKGARA